MEQLGDRLRSERQRLRLDAAALAVKAGLPPGRVQAIEAGEAMAQADDLAALAGAGVDVGYLLTGSAAAREAQLLTNFRGADEEGRSAVGGAAGAAAPKRPRPTLSKKVVGVAAAALAGVVIVAALTDKGGSEPGGSPHSTASPSGDYFASPAASSSEANLPPPTPRPRYAMRDGMRYGYEPAISAQERRDGTVAKPLVMLAYVGKYDGAHQLVALTDADMKSDAPRLVTVYDWVPGEAFIKASEFFRGKLAAKQFLRAEPSSVVMSAMLDAERGHLERYVHRPSGGRRGAWVFCLEDKGCGSLAMPKSEAD